MLCSGYLGDGQGHVSPGALHRADGVPHLRPHHPGHHGGEVRLSVLYCTVLYSGEVRLSAINILPGPLWRLMRPALHLTDIKAAHTLILRERLTNSRFFRGITKKDIGNSLLFLFLYIPLVVT